MAHATTRVSAALARAVRGHTRAIVRHLSRARRGDVRAVHQVRVASRRLREALSVVAVALSGRDDARAARRDVRRLTAVLGRVREIDVARAVLDDEARAHEWPVRIVDRVRAHLDEARAHRGRHLGSQLARIDVDAFASRLDAVAEACERSTTTALSVRAVAARLRKRAREFDVAVRRVGPLYSPEALHGARIAAKKLRYTLELVRDGAHAPVARDLTALKTLQTALGHLHDLQVLQIHLRAVAAEALDRPTVQALERAEATLGAECRALHATVLGGSPRLQALADRLGRVSRIRPAIGSRLPMARMSAPRSPRAKARVSA